MLFPQDPESPELNGTAINSLNINHTWTVMQTDSLSPLVGTTTIVQDEPSRILQRRMPQVDSTMPTSTLVELSKNGKLGGVVRHVLLRVEFSNSYIHE